MKRGFQQENVSDRYFDLFDYSCVCKFSRNGIEYFEIRFYFNSTPYYTSDDRKHGKKVVTVCRHVAISSLCEALWTYI
jgi:hypothetical protein